MQRDVLLSSAELRRDLSGRNSLRAQAHSHELTYSRTPSVIYGPSEEGCHGNFIQASYRRILARPEWRRRLEKSYTGSKLIPRSQDRQRGELECATSSDALLMNIFCFPGLLHRRAVCSLLAVPLGSVPEFGIRTMLPMKRGEIDRTEIDMRLGDLLVEAKLTESGFGTASRERLFRYETVEDVFEIDALPRRREAFAEYQLVRGVLAARHANSRYAMLCDARRADLREAWFRVLQAVRSSELRSRMTLLHWQELASVTPRSLRIFLDNKYGIVAAKTEHS